MCIKHMRIHGRKKKHMRIQTNKLTLIFFFETYGLYSTYATIYINNYMMEYPFLQQYRVRLSQ
jgi:hypothetical protein